MSPRAQFLTTALTVFVGVMIVFVTAMLLSLRNEVMELKESMVTEETLAQSRVPQLRLFAEEECTSCHTERRFLTEHRTSDQLMAIVKKMGAMPDVHLTDREVNLVHASLNVLKCTQCHESDVLKSLALKSESERLAIIKAMAKKRGSRITPEEVMSIHKGLELILGF
ncbi:MAG: hypothetical protein ACE5OP_08345 [Candidatus Glassbacteria bacterium]